MRRMPAMMQLSVCVEEEEEESTWLRDRKTGLRAEEEDLVFM